MKEVHVFEFIQSKLKKYFSLTTMSLPIFSLNLTLYLNSIDNATINDFRIK